MAAAATWTAPRFGGDDGALVGAGRDALQVEDRDQRFEALRPPRIARQDVRTEPDALVVSAGAIAHAGLAHRHGADAGHDRTLGQMPVPHDPPTAIRGRAIGVAGEKIRHLGLSYA